MYRKSSIQFLKSFHSTGESEAPIAFNLTPTASFGLTPTASALPGRHLLRQAGQRLAVGYYGCARECLANERLAHVKYPG